VGIAVLLCYSSPAKACYTIAKGIDYAPLLNKTITVSRPVDLAPLFDKFPDPKTGTRVQFCKGNEELEATFSIPAELPLLQSIRITGKGKIWVNIVDKNLAQNSKMMVLLDDSNPTWTVPSYPDYAAGSVVLKGEARMGDVYVTDLQLLASDQLDVEDESWDAGSDDDGEWWQQENQVDVLETEGCVCAGFPRPDETGYRCAEWDDDCKGQGGWCYTRKGACNDSRVSSQYQSMEWSCAPCGNGSAVQSKDTPKPIIKPKPKAKPKKAKAVSCGTCTGSLVLGTFGGLALGTVLMVMFSHRRQVKAAGYELEMGHAD
jgi:hypothetical protein